MSIRGRYGYLISALNQYPFEKEIASRLEEIETPWKPSDSNSTITKGTMMTPKALADIIRSRVASTRFDEKGNHRSERINTNTRMVGDQRSIY